MEEVWLKGLHPQALPTRTAEFIVAVAPSRLRLPRGSSLANQGTQQSEHVTVWGLRWFQTCKPKNRHEMPFFVVISTLNPQLSSGIHLKQPCFCGVPTVRGRKDGGRDVERASRAV